MNDDDRRRRHWMSASLRHEDRRQRVEKASFCGRKETRITRTAAGRPTSLAWDRAHSLTHTTPFLPQLFLYNVVDDNISVSVNVDLWSDADKNNHFQAN